VGFLVCNMHLDASGRGGQKGYYGPRTGFRDSSKNAGAASADEGLSQSPHLMKVADDLSKVYTVESPYGVVNFFPALEDAKKQVGVKKCFMRPGQVDLENLAKKFKDYWRCSLVDDLFDHEGAWSDQPVYYVFDKVPYQTLHGKASFRPLTDFRSNNFSLKPEQVIYKITRKDV